MGYQVVFCESDSLELVNILNSRDGFEFHLFAYQLLQVVDLINRHWMVHISHIHREANFCADSLAKRGLRAREGLQVWKDPRGVMGSLILHDSLGASLD